MQSDLIREDGGECGRGGGRSSIWDSAFPNKQCWCCWSSNHTEQQCPVLEHTHSLCPSQRARISPGCRDHLEHHCPPCLPKSRSSSASYTQVRTHPADDMWERAPGIPFIKGPTQEHQEKKEKRPTPLGIFNIKFRTYSCKTCHFKFTNKW